MLWNFILFSILFYFTNFQELFNAISKIDLRFLLGGIFLTYIFTIFSGIKWLRVVEILSKISLKHVRFNFVKISFRKEFLSSFTSGFVGDIYSIFAISNLDKKNIIKSLILNKFYDLFVVAVVSILPLFLYRYINISSALILFLILILCFTYINQIIKISLSILNRFNTTIKSLNLISEIPNINSYEKINIIILTIIQWCIRLGASYFTLLSLGISMNFIDVIAITFLPIIFSLVTFVLPKSISGDSATIAVGLLLNIGYPYLLGYVIIHRIYSLLISLVGILMGFIPNDNFLKHK